ncbi:MAG: undecaprenyl-diphosphate phosphatase [Planctomycetota bacterium]|jgi:undecaprenyl-diphosphatase
MPCVSPCSRSKPRWIGAALIITGGLLAVMKVLPRAKRGWKDFRWWQAVLVGVAQAGTIMPGISRSGSTICIASYLGLRRRWAAEFSFLIAVPAIVGAALVKLKDTLELPRAVFETIPIGPVVLGSAAALLTGVLALIILLNAVRRAKLHYFAPYCWLLGALLVCGALD